MQIFIVTFMLVFIIRIIFRPMVEINLFKQANRSCSERQNGIILLML